VAFSSRRLTFITADGPGAYCAGPAPTAQERTLISSFMGNLFRPSWRGLETGEIKIILTERIGGPGQFDGADGRTLCLPQGGASCRLRVSFNARSVVGLFASPAFDQTEWGDLITEIEGAVNGGTDKVGRDISFSSFRVPGYWRGAYSGVQILPPPEGAPLPPYETGDHPFILEFPLKATSRWSLTNHRRRREHRRLTLLLNLLLAGRTSAPNQRSRHLWALVDTSARWVQESHFADFGPTVIDALSEPPPTQLAEFASARSYARSGQDGRP
jgi:hypothetical protein